MMLRNRDGDTYARTVPLPVHYRKHRRPATDLPLWPIAVISGLAGFIVGRAIAAFF